MVIFLDYWINSNGSCKNFWPNFQSKKLIIHMYTCIHKDLYLYAYYIEKRNMKCFNMLSIVSFSLLVALYKNKDVKKKTKRYTFANVFALKVLVLS